MSAETWKDIDCVDQGVSGGPSMVLLHGLFGDPANWTPMVEEFSKDYNVLAPCIPFLGGQGHGGRASLDYIFQGFCSFVAERGLKNMVLMGSSLGGHLVLRYALAYPKNVRAMVLTGSSGLYERTPTTRFPKRRDKKFIQEFARHIFYEERLFLEDIMAKAFEVWGTPIKGLYLVSLLRGIQKDNLGLRLPEIKSPTLLAWGLNDTITPPSVAHEFQKKMPRAQIKFFDKCCHAPMMEHPLKFNQAVRAYLSDLD
ncbi:MAG: alpha/beta hydrolase [Cytophagales bacterium]|nr:alpha/beta hydrolase [Cytophagales bacterium]